MDKYTIEQLRTGGTRFRFPEGNRIKYTTTSCPDSVNGLTDFNYRQDLIVCGKQHDNFIEFNNALSYPTGKIHFLVPISEFERLGMLKSEEKKYTIDYLKEVHIPIKVENVEQLKEIDKISGERYDYFYNSFPENPIYIFLDTYTWTFDLNCYENAIDYQTFIEHNKQEKTMNEIPQYFCVKNDGTEEFKQYIEWLNNKYEVNYGGISNDYYGYDGISNNKGTYNYSDKNEFKNNPIVFESAKEFMELVNKTNKNNTMEKPQTFKILGKEHQLKAIWQDLMDMGYENGTMNNEWKAISQLRENRDFKTLTYSCNVNWLNVTFNLPQDYSKALEHAQKCLELLKPKEIIHSVGGKFDVKIKDGKIYHENSDITRFVKEMIDYFIPNGDNVRGFGGFFAKIKEVEFESTGCQKVVTKLSDWLELWNKYKETIK